MTDLDEEGMEDLFGSDEEQQHYEEDTREGEENGNRTPNAGQDDFDNVINKSQNDEDGIEDLFGSDEENPHKAEDRTSSASRSPGSGKASPKGESEERDEDRLGSKTVDGEEEEEGMVDEFGDKIPEAKVRNELPLELPILTRPHSVDSKYYLTKVPVFLDVEPKPFNPDSFAIHVDESVNDEDLQDHIRMQVESTMRWRMGKDAASGDEIKESNARVVKWSDGSFSLILGKEVFDITTKSMANQDYQYLLAHHPQPGILQSHLKLTDFMQIRPSDLRSDTHRLMTAKIAGKHLKTVRTKMVVTEKDPELVKQEAEMRESEKLRAQRRLEASRRRAANRFDYRLTEDALEAGYSDEELGGRAGDHYEDDFVVDDEEEEEEDERERAREERILKAKTSGMDKYRRDMDASEEEEEAEETPSEEEEADADEEEDQVVHKGKRRRVVSDEEEE